MACPGTPPLGALRDRAWLGKDILDVGICWRKRPVRLNEAGQVVEHDEGRLALEGEVACFV
ncbi:MAG: hypothetical protein QXT77_08065 [Candidatus Methanomethylicaceae archaeon]